MKLFSSKIIEQQIMKLKSNGKLRNYSLSDKLTKTSFQSSSFDSHSNLSATIYFSLFVHKDHEKFTIYKYQNAILKVPYQSSFTYYNSIIQNNELLPINEKHALSSIIPSHKLLNKCIRTDNDLYFCADNFVYNRLNGALIHKYMP